MMKKKRKAPRGPRKASKHEQKFLALWHSFGKGECAVSEYSAIPGRKFKFDFAFLVSRIMVELDGGIWHPGGHTSGTGKMRDCEKDWLAFRLGWTVIRWTPDMITADNIRILGDIVSERAGP